MKGAERSRTGCGRCKARRVKCDEKWPTCGRCARLKVSCSGPALQLRWSKKHELHRTSCREACPQLSTEQKAQHVPTSRIAAFPSAAQQPGRAAPNNVDFFDYSLHSHSPLPDLVEPDFAINGGLGFAALQHPVQGSRAVLNSDLDSPQSHSQRQSPPRSVLDFFFDTSIALGPPDVDSQLQSTGSPSDALLEMTPGSHLPASPLDNSCSTSRYDYSRLSQEAPPLIDTLPDYRTKLVEFYFKDAASILTVFDGNLNPFRTIVGRLWTSSNLLFLTIKSMSAVFLSNIYPQMAAVGASLRKDAIAILASLRQEEMDEKDLLALFMIGGTASWFDTDDIGQEHFSIMIGNVQRMTASGQIASTSNNRHFFRDLLVCWRMFLAFIDDNAIDGEDDDDLPLSVPTPVLLNSPNQPAFLEIPTFHVPHPLTGVASGVQRCLIKIGRLVRRNRRLVHDGRLNWVSRATIQELNEELKEAERLEATLFKMKVPSVEEIVDTGDARTPTWHLATLAKVYRHIGLLLLYRVFSDVRASARRRLCKELFCDQSLETNERHEGAANEIHEEGVDDAEWLRALALRIVAALQSIPIESGTKDFHPFLLVAVSSDLAVLAQKGSDSSAGSDHRRQNFNLNHGHGHEQVDKETLELPPGALDVYAARAFVLGRLHALQFALPGRPIRRCLEIVNAVWESEGDNQCPFWMDVMIRNNWETFMA